MKPEFGYKSRMERDKLVIDGKRYRVNDLSQLPQKLSLFEVTTKVMMIHLASLVNYVHSVTSILQNSRTIEFIITAANS